MAVPDMYTLTPAELELFKRHFGINGWRAAEGGETIDENEILLQFEIETSPGIRIVSLFDFTESQTGVAVYPSAGVRHDAVSGLYDRLCGLPGGGSWTFAINLTDLLYRDGVSGAPYVRWLITSTDSAVDVAVILRGDIDKYARPALEPLLTIEGVVARLVLERRSQAQNGQLAVAYALTSSIAESTRPLAEYVAETERQPNALATQSWRFVRSFVEHFHIDHSMLPFRIPNEYM